VLLWAYVTAGSLQVCNIILQISAILTIPQKKHILYRAKHARPEGMSYGMPCGYTLSCEARLPEGHELRA
jgi:hypothetical protein